MAKYRWGGLSDKMINQNQIIEKYLEVIDNQGDKAFDVFESIKTKIINSSIPFKYTMDLKTFAGRFFMVLKINNIKNFLNCISVTKIGVHLEVCRLFIAQVGPVKKFITTQLPELPEDLQDNLDLICFNEIIKHAVINTIKELQDNEINNLINFENINFNNNKI